MVTLTKAEAQSLSKRQTGRLAKADGDVAKSDHKLRQTKSDMDAAKKQLAKLQESCGKAKETLRDKTHARNDEIWAVKRGLKEAKGGSPKASTKPPIS